MKKTNREYAKISTVLMGDKDTDDPICFRIFKWKTFFVFVAFIPHIFYNELLFSAEEKLGTCRRVRSWTL